MLPNLSPTATVLRSRSSWHVMGRGLRSFATKTKRFEVESYRTNCMDCIISPTNARSPAVCRVFTIVGNPLSSHFLRSCRFPISYKRSVLPIPTKSRPWKCAIERTGPSDIAVRWSSCNLSPFITRYSSTWLPDCANGCIVIPVTVPTASSASPPREWKRTDAQQSAASFRPISTQSSVEHESEGSTRRTQDPQCPGSGGKGPRIGVATASSSSSSISSSSSLAASASVSSFLSSSSSDSSISMASSSFLSSFLDFFPVPPVPSNPMAVFSSRP
mmetsp:Transcript_15478/g.33672  ORF Transcript_15478/g.33672 Transcript_15478/m.33672 type:complete len:274 (-) Transcript_15478:2807-3628(-)